MELNVKKDDLPEEYKILLDVIRAYKHNDIDALIIATASYNKFQYESHIKERISLSARLNDNTKEFYFECLRGSGRATNKIKPTKLKILNFIFDYTTEHDYPPTMREICCAVGLKSSSTVYTHLNNLIKDGYITKESDKSRCLTINKEKYLNLFGE